MEQDPFKEYLKESERRRQLGTCIYRFWPMTIIYDMHQRIDMEKNNGKIQTVVEGVIVTEMEIWQCKKKGRCMVIETEDREHKNAVFVDLRQERFSNSETAD